MDNDTANTLRVINTTSLISALTNAVLALLKIIFGILGFSYALLTDGIHSLSDVIIDGLVVVSAKFASAGPDIEHPYGHRRIETIGTIVIALVILFIGVSFLLENALRLVRGAAAQHPLPIVFIVALISVIANEWLYRYMLAKGKAISSQLLQTNAWHNRSDALTSVVVLISAVFSWLGYYQVDAIAAILISLFIIKMGAMYAWRSLKELIDTGVSAELLSTIQTSIEATPGVLSIHLLRTRLHADRVLLDAHVQVAPAISVSEGHHIGVMVYQAIKQAVPNLLDATIHIDVEDDDEKHYNEPTLPSRNDIMSHLSTHAESLPRLNCLKNLTLHYLDQGISAELFFPLTLLEEIEPDTLFNDYKACLNQINGVQSVSIHFSSN